jgi:hypothetical protein
MKANKKFLVVSSIGDDSLHNHWKEGENRDFDLILDYYGDKPDHYKYDCELYFQRKGTKFPKFYQIIKENPDLIFQYEAVWIPDDDLMIQTDEINGLFGIFSENELLLAQPALTHDSYSGFWKGVTLENSNYNIRYTNFVEVMAPIFSRDALMKCWETFKLSQSGYGLDLVWPKLLGDPEDKISIIDAIKIRHLRPSGAGDLYKNIKVNRMEEMHRVCEVYKINLPYKAVTFGGLMKKPGEINC